MNKKIKNIILQAILLATIIVASKLTIPTGFVPFTLQILVILIVSFLLDWKSGTIILVVYFLLGVIGLPVFSSPICGVAIFISPTFGFIVGFLLMPIIVDIFKGIFSKVIKNEYAVYFLSGMVALFIDYLLGFIYALVLYKVFMVLETNMTVFKILVNFVIIFIPFDIIKCVLSTIICKRIKNSTTS